MTTFSQHFTYRKLLRFSFPPIIMMIFTSVYGVVDGLFLSNFAGKEAFAAANFAIPYLMLFNGVGFMFGTGGSALIAKVMGQGDDIRANHIFSALYRISIYTGLLFLLVGQLLFRPAAYLLGARGQLLEQCMIYGRIYMLGMPFCILQFESENFYAAAGKPKLGLFATVSSGIINILLDALFILVFHWGLAGAAAATALAQFTGGMISLCYFSRPNQSPLHLVRCKIDWHAIGRILSNGLSEVVNNISINTVGMLYNVQLLRYAGSDGVASYGILMYVNFVFTAIFWGYIVGGSPLISFQYGADNKEELHNLFHKSMVLIGIASLAMFLSAELLAKPVSQLFVGYDARLMAMTLRGFLMFSFNFIFAGFAIFSASFFTALNNGLLSAILSFLRTFFFQVFFILVLPIFWQVDGIWLALVAAEFCSFLTGAAALIRQKKRYGY